MKKLALAFVLLPGLAFAQQSPPPASPQAQIFSLQQQLALVQSQDNDILARAYDLVQQVQSLNAEIATLKQAAQKTTATIMRLKK